MSVTFPLGFRAVGLSAGIKSNGNRDLAIVVNDGPEPRAAAVFTSNRFAAAPVLWTRQVMKSGAVKAVVINSGGANACTGPVGFGDTHRTAEHAAGELGFAPIEIAVCSTGLIGERLPMDRLLNGISTAVTQLSDNGGEAAAEAIMTTDSVPKLATFVGDGWSIGGMAKGAGMLAPGLATMLVTITTDALVDSAELQSALEHAAELTFNRIDSDGCMSTNDTVLLLASGASAEQPTPAAFLAGLTQVCGELARALIADAEGASKDIEINVSGAASTQEALEVARAVSRSNLLKCAIHGEDPNWGRVLSAVGTTSATFEPDEVDVALNGVWVARKGAAGESRSACDLSGRVVKIEINLNAGRSAASLWTNDLTAMYVHENSAYSS